MPVNLMSRLTLCSLMVPGLMAVSSLSLQAEEKKEEPKKITYDEHILPIFRQRCGSCHNGNDQKGGLVLDSYAGMMQGGGSGDVLELGDAGSSYLYMVVNHDSEPYMPPNQPKMPEQELALIRDWINMGALENKGSKVVKKKNDLAKIEISMDRPADAPVLPQGVPLNPVMITPSANSITALAVSPWASLAAVSGQEQVLLYSTQTGLLSGVLPFPEGVPQILKFSRNGQMLLAGGGRVGASGKVVVWDVKTGQRVAELGNEYDSVLAADISPDHTLVVLSGPKRLIRVFSVQTGEMLYELKKHTDWVLAAEFSPDGVLLATADRSNGMFLWESLTGNEYLSLKGHTGAITDVSWRPDSNAVGSCSEDGTIRLWELNDGNEIKRWNAHGGGVSAMDFTRDARVVSIGRDKVVKLWQADGKELKAFGGLPDLGLEVAFDSELNRALGGDWSGDVRVWDANSGAHLLTLAPNPPALSDQLSSTQQNLQQAEQSLTAAKTQIQNLQNQIAARKQAYEAAVQKGAELEQSLKGANSEKTALEKSLADLKPQLGTLQKAYEALQAQQSTLVQSQQAAEKAVTDLTGQQKKLTEEQIAAEKAAATMTAQIAELQPQGDAGKEQLEKAQTELQQVQQGIEARKGELSKLSTDLTAQQAAIAQSAKQQKDLAPQITAAKQNYESAVNVGKTTEAKLAPLSAKLKELASQLESQKKQIGELQPKVAATDEENKKLAELTAAMKQAEQSVQTLQAHVQEIQKQIAGSAQASAK